MLCHARTKNGTIPVLSLIHIYLPKATLSGIYKMIRKDVKVNGKRSKLDAFLEEGDIITLYLDDKKIDQLSVRKKIKRDVYKRQIQN